tara:strand:- start:601 stop:876 length:276 start_codon:yes stop_codon:yes gene_type:complete
MIMNVLILTVAFLFMFVGGIFVGRELTYLADGRRRRKERRLPPDAEPYDEILDLDLIASYDPETGLYKDEIPPVAGGYIDDESKHWPKGSE